MWDPVPWFTGGGAQHSPEIARVLAYAALGGAEGIAEPGNLKVSALTVPGPSVNVAPGAAVIRNRSTGGDQQAYVGRNPTQDTVGITATGGTKRSDLIVARVEDPFMVGTPWQHPADPTAGPYIFTRVIPNVPAGTTSVAGLNLGYSAIPLARVDVPANTGAIQPGYIVDLRKVARPRRDRQVFTRALVSGEAEVQNNSTVGEWWPNVGYWTAQIPEWATRAKVVATWAGVRVPPGNAAGTLWARIGYPPSTPVDTQRVNYDTPGATSVFRTTFVAADDIAIPAELRGTSQTVNLMAVLTNGAASAARISLDGGSAVVMDIEFYESAV